MELEFDLYDNDDPQTISYTTSSTGAVTVSQSNYITATVNANNTITVTPVAVTNGPQTITVNQAADATYAAGSVTFTVDIEDSTPFTGGDVTFDATIDKGTSPLIKNGVTFACNNGVLNNGSEYRLYKNSVTTFSVSQGTITQIVFTGVSGYPASGFATQTGWTTDGNNGTWTGNAQSVSFTASGAQVRATQIVVTVDLNATPNPIINAEDVNIACDATNGSISYTIDNEPDPAGILTAAIVEGGTIANLTIGTVTGSSVPFSCDANTTGTARTSHVILTYTYGDNESVTKDVTVTQAAASVIYSTIPDLFAAATSTETNVFVTFNNWVVSGVSTNGKNVFVTDNEGHGFVIYSANDMSSTYSAGKVLAGTAVSCTLKLYNGFAELLNVNATDLTITDNGTVTTSEIDMANLTGINTGALVHYDNLTCSVNNNKYYLSDGTTTIQVYNALFAFDALEADHVYNITGVYQQYNSTKEVLPRSAADIVEVVITEPAITITPLEITVDAESQQDYLNISFVNFVPTTGYAFTCDANGTFTDYSWLVAELDINNSRVRYTIGNNEEVARTGYFRVRCGDVYSEIVTVNQAAYVPPFESATYIPATEINPDKRYIIVGFNGDDAYAMGYQKTNNRDAVGISFDGTTATVETSEVYELVIANQGDYYTIYDERTPGFLYAASDEKNWLRTEEVLDDDGNGLWNITFGEQGLVDLEAVNTDVRNVMQFNAGSSTTDPLFACYASANQEPVYLFEKVESAEYTLEITGYTDDSEKTGYHLIASPVFVDPYLVGMADGDFDLYSFDQSEGEEWRNYEAGSFTMLEPGKGYLYAKKATDNVQTYYFNLSGTPYVGDGYIDLAYDANEGVSFPGLNLIGNPFGEEATLNIPYYRMNSTGSGLEAVNETESPVNVMEGVFVYAEYNSEYGYVTNYAQFTPNGNTSGGGMKINLTRNRGTAIDNAIVRFDEGQQLPKFQLFENSTKLYIPQGNKDYAIVRSAAQGEMPVSFRASENGTYTLSIEAENVEMNYLHLIDNKTGADVDLLATPNYTFEARTNDYTSRFRLVFSANGTTDNEVETFAYFNGSNWTVNNLGEATLQVVDVTGRTVSSETINGNATVSLNQPAGIYMLRLVSGNDVKVQKVAVK